MTDDIAIKVENLTKTYRLYNSSIDRLKESLHPFRHTYHQEFNALYDVSFDVKKCETFGIIGHNGAGKSTLLKIITGILTQTSGTVHVNGNISALLELGSGFNPELTGIENIFFHATLSGFSRKQIEDRLDDVLSFADIGEYIHQPVKSYSSGMFVRLAFSVSLMISPQILIIDEALAVGDVFFQQKCYKQLDLLQKNGVAILLATHSMGDVMQHCRRSILLNHGRLEYFGDARECVKKFFFIQQQPHQHPEFQSETEEEFVHAVIDEDSTYFWPHKTAFVDLSKAVMISDGSATCTAVAICDKEGNSCNVFLPGEEIFFYYEFSIAVDIEIPVGGILLANNRNIIVHGKNSLEYSTDCPPSYVRAGSRVRYRQKIKLDILPGEYTLNVGFSILKRNDYLLKNTLPHFDLLARLTRLCNAESVARFSIAGFPLDWPSDKIHHGLCNLPGGCEVYLN